MDWKPISTAPKDGSIILGYSAEAETPQMFHVMYLDFEDEDGGDWYVADASHGMPFDCELSHWQPLPEPPALP